MIWGSIPLMTAIDLLVSGGLLFSIWYFWARRTRWRKAGSQFGALLTLIGLTILSGFFLCDLFLIHALPRLWPETDWMAVTRTLHLEYSWVIIPTRIGAIVAGFVSVNRDSSHLVRKLEDSERRLTEELAAHQRTETALRGSEERLRRIMEIAPEGMLLVDQDFRIRIFNRAAESFFGYPAEDVLGSQVFRLAPVRLRDQYRERLSKFALVPEASRTIDEPEASICLRKDGSEFRAEVVVSKFS
jgi:PAS domain S-box-containing protein